MNKILVAASLLLLAGCSITKEPKVSNVDTTNGLIRLSFNQAMMQNAHYDEYTTQGLPINSANRWAMQQQWLMVSQFRPVA
jgi:uncharacterized lipoprotein YajG